MKKFLCIFLLLFSSLQAQPKYHSTSVRTLQTKGQAAVNSSTYLIASSMITWGVVFGVSAALLAAFVQNREE